MIPTTLPATFWFSLKLLTLVGIGVYMIFAAVMARQEQLMANVLEEAFEPVLRILTIVHLFAAVGMLLLAFLLL